MVLLELVEEIGGEEIDEIIVPAPNILIFKFKNGTTLERKWQDRSRALSWTAEMREAARQKELDRRKNTDGKSD